MNERQVRTSFKQKAQQERAGTNDEDETLKERLGRVGEDERETEAG